MSAEAPWLARILARITAASDDGDLLLADLHERFVAITEEEGVGAARRWYSLQAFRGMHAWLRPDLELLSRRSWEGTLGDVRQGVTLAGLGMILGFVAWYMSLPATRGLLGEMDASDPWLPLTVAALVGSVSTLASALPARRTVAADPAVTLRAE